MIFNIYRYLSIFNIYRYFSLLPWVKFFQKIRAITLEILYQKTHKTFFPAVHVFNFLICGFLVFTEALCYFHNISWHSSKRLSSYGLEHIFTCVCICRIIVYTPYVVKLDCLMPPSDIHVK